METKISSGNSKLGNIPNVSLIPIKDCANCEACKKSCYALKAWRQYPLTRAAWSHNSKLARTNFQEYFMDIIEYLKKKRPAYFRWHVAGDILHQKYYRYMCGTARMFPETNFLCFTKRFDLDYSGRPKNLAIVLSMYPGMKTPRKRMPRAWMQDGTEKRIPEDAIECSGHCDTCNVCWDLKQQDVYFHKH
jgi:hypothetical protein